MNIFILGLGLIGGSMALNLRKLMPKATFLGIDSNKAHINQALSLGIIDIQADYVDLNKADMVIISIPSDLVSQVLTNVLDRVGEHTVVMDTTSTKHRICESVASHPKRKNFVAMHPIAGTEFSGPKAALLDLFSQKINIICQRELTDVDILKKTEDICRQMGMQIRYMDAYSHDLHIAYVSHLSHITSFMLGKTVIEKEKNEQRIFDMAGSGFESTVRLAKSSPTTWTAIFKENKDNILSSLKEYISNLKHFEMLLEDDAFEDVYKELENTNRIKTILEGIKTN